FKEGKTYALYKTPDELAEAVLARRDELPILVQRLIAETRSERSDYARLGPTGFAARHPMTALHEARMAAGSALYESPIHDWEIKLSQKSNAGRLVPADDAAPAEPSSAPPKVEVK